MRIATLDDGREQIDTIRKAIEAIGFECDVFADESSLIEALRQLSCQMLVLDLRMPRLDRLRWLRRMREELGPRLPVLAIAVSTDDADMIDALSAGADDFMAKPLHMLQFQARVRALIRRCYPNQNETVLNFGPFRFFTLKRTVHLRGEPIILKMREYDLALYLFKNIGRLLTREHLLEAVWNTQLESPTRSLDTHMSRLRTKLELRPANGVLLSAIYGLGYRLEFIDGQSYAISANAPAASRDPARDMASELVQELVAKERKLDLAAPQPPRPAADDLPSGEQAMTHQALSSE